MANGPLPIDLHSPCSSSFTDSPPSSVSRNLTAEEVTAADEMIMERAEDLAEDEPEAAVAANSGEILLPPDDDEDQQLFRSVANPSPSGFGGGSSSRGGHHHHNPAENLLHNSPLQHYSPPLQLCSPTPPASISPMYSRPESSSDNLGKPLFSVGLKSLQRRYSNDHHHIVGSTAPLLLPRSNTNIAAEDPRRYSWRRAARRPTPPPDWRVPPMLRDSRRKAAGARAARQRQFVVVEISLGKSKRHFVHTPELLRLVHSHNCEGRSQEGKPGSLKLRDLRQICNQSLGGQRASIELRRNCILFNLCGVKCIIMHEKIILIPRGFGNSARAFPVSSKEGGPTSFSVVETEEEALIQKLLRITELRGVGGHFEFAVLESLLVEICSFLTDELSPIVQEAGMMRDLTGGRLSSVLRLHEISEFKRKLDNLCDRLRGASEAIQELLDNEEDLRRLELTRFWLTPAEWEHPKDTPASEDAEMLLECYEQELESMLRQATRIDESLDDALQLVQLRLASIRNAFLKSELGLDIVGTVVGCVGAIAGIFGMNVPNGWEQNPNVFWPMTQVMLLLCALTAVLVIVMFKRVQL